VPNEIATASVRIEPDFAGFAGGVQRGVQQQTRNLRQSATQLGGTLTAAVTLPVAALGAGAVKAFASFDSAMTQSQAIMGDLTENEMASMEAKAREIGKTTTFSATQAAESYFFLASAGLDAEQSVAALPAVAAFAQAGMFDMATATDLATDAQSALGLTVDDAGENLENMTRVTDVLVKANTLANASVQQFSESLTTKAGTALKTYNKEVEEGVAVLSVYADRGIKGQIAGELLSRTIKFLSIRADENREEFRRLNIEVFDAEGNMRHMADISDDLTNSLGDLSDAERSAELAALGFTGRTQDAILQLLDAGDAIRFYEAGLKSAAGITEEVAKRQLGSFSAQLDIAKSRIIDVGISLGEQLAPALLTAANFAASATEFFAAMPAPLKRLAGILAVVAAAVGPILLIGGKLAQALLAVRALTGGYGRGIVAANAYAQAQGRAAVATGAVGAAAGRTAVGVSALSNAQLRAALVPGAGAAAAGPSVGALARGAGGGILGAGLLKAGGGVGVAKAAGAVGLAGAGGFLAGDLVAGFIQGVETEEGTMGDKVKDVAGNAVRFGVTGAGIGLAVGGPVGAAIGGGIGVVAGGILGAVTSDKSVDAAAEKAKRNIEEVLGETVAGLDLSSAQKTALAGQLDTTTAFVVEDGIKRGLGQVEAAGLVEPTAEVLNELLLRGVDPDRFGPEMARRVADGLESGTDPQILAQGIARTEAARTEAIAAGLIDEDALQAQLEDELRPTFAELFTGFASEGANAFAAFQNAINAGATDLDLGLVADTLVSQLESVPSIFENQFGKAKKVSTAKMLEIAQANRDAFATFEGDLRTLTEAGLVGLAQTLADKGPAAANEAAALANDLETALQIEASIRGIAQADIDAFLSEFEGADSGTVAQGFIDRFVDPMGAIGEEAKAAIAAGLNPGEIIALGGEIPAGLGTGIEQNTSAATEAGTAMSIATLAAIVAPFATASPSKATAEMGADLSAGVGVGIEDGAPGAFSAAETMAGGVLDATEGGLSPAAAASIGNQYIAGLERGILSRLDTTLSRVRSKVGQINTTARSTLGIRSPSSIAEEIGAQYIAGLNRGLTTPVIAPELGTLTSGDAPAPVSRTTNVTINNPTVESADTDVQRAAVFDRLVGVTR
jgi:TP901 family phage tail tape measure protein